MKHFKKLLSFLIVIAMCAAILPVTAMAMQVYISVETSGETSAIDAEPANTIEDVKEKIFDTFGYAADQQQLYYEEQLLEDSQTLSDCGIQEEATLRLVLNSYAVSLADGLSGADTATYGTNYTGSIDSFSTSYDYTVSYTVGGGEVQNTAVDSGTGEFTISGEAITGELEVTFAASEPTSSAAETEAEAQTETDTLCGHGNSAASCAVCDLEEQIAALPALEEIQAMTGDKEEAVYAQASALADVYYDDLTADEQVQVSNIDTLWDILDYFSGSLTLALSASSCTHSYTNGFCTVCGAYQPATLNGSTYEISNAGQLFWFAALVNGDTTQEGITAAVADANAILTADIDLDGAEWTPIGDNSSSSSLYYGGTFDGDGCTIKGLYIYGSGNQGLFGYVKSGTVQNVTVSGNVTGERYVGGVVGQNYNGTVENCNSNVTVIGSMDVGGIAGLNSGTGTVTNCSNSGTVSCTGNGYNNVGGVVGENGGTVTDCSNGGKVSGYSRVGGVIGLNWGSVSNCYNSGAVSGNSSVGGVVGDNNFINGYYSPIVTNCYYLNTTASAAYGANSGTIGNDVLSKTLNEFASGEVTYLLNGSVSGGTTWYQNIDNGKTADSYPVLSSSSGKVYTAFQYMCDGSTVITKTYSNTEKSNEVQNHSWDEGIVTIAATCTEDGEKIYTCTVCSETKTEKIEATGHSLTYTASENAITESCANGCGHSATATLAEPSSLAYDGSSKAASVSYDADWMGDTPTVECLDSSGAAVDADSVVNAGTYTAQITVGGATASVSFTITAAQLSAPSNLQWSGTTTTVTASWDEVTNASSYTVQLYKDGTAESSAVSVTGTSTTFTITEAGSYTFTVAAVGTGNYGSSAASAASAALVYYTVTWENGDTALKTDVVQSGATPSYSGDEPTKTTDDTYIYTFSGWSPEVGAITANTTYTAQYSKTYVAPTTGAGYTIDYSAETAAAASGYEISTGGSAWSGTLTVEPSGTLYVRRAADAAASASAETTNTLASRPTAPSVMAEDEQ